MTRKEFLAASAAMMAAGGSRFVATAADGTKPIPPLTTPNSQPSTPSPRNRHPYRGIDWATAHQVRSTTHVHCKTQADLDVILLLMVLMLKF